MAYVVMAYIVMAYSVCRAGLVGQTVLVDMDNTIVDWDAEFVKRYPPRLSLRAHLQMRRT